MQLVARNDLCFVCREPIPQRGTGRPRKTCGDRCRQRMRRKYSPQSAEFAAKTKAAWQTIRGWERRFGALIETHPEWGGLTLRDRLLIRLQRGWPIAFCSVCARPFMPDSPVASGEQCSGKCIYVERTLRQRAVEKENADVVVRLREKIGAITKRCKHCGIKFAPANLRREYHSGACRTAAHRKRWGKCEDCGEKYRRESITHRYCTKRCAWRAKEKRKKLALLATLTAPICRWCGEMIDLDKRARKRGLIYCDPICQSRHSAFRHGRSRKLPKKSPLRVGELAHAAPLLDTRRKRRVTVDVD